LKGNLCVGAGAFQDRWSRCIVMAVRAGVRKTENLDN
jgi:hypothetical protein